MEPIKKAAPTGFRLETVSFQAIRQQGGDAAPGGASVVRRQFVAQAAEGRGAFGRLLAQVGHFAQ